MNVRPTGFNFGLIVLAVWGGLGPCAMTRADEQEAGEWKISYGNGAVRVYTIDRHGKMQGTAAGGLTFAGQAVCKDSTVILTFSEPDNLERFTLNGDQLTSELWDHKQDYPEQKPSQTGNGVRTRPPPPLARQPGERDFWIHDGGYFENTGGKEWEEHHTSPDFHFVEKDRTDKYVELFDKSRDMTVRLYDDRQEDSKGRAPFFVLKRGSWAAKPPAPAVPAVAVVRPKPAAPPPPPVFNLCKDQTPIRNQGDRDTCPFFAPVAAMEAAYKRLGVNVDLSSEDLEWIRDVTAENDSVKPGAAENIVSTLGNGDASGIITKYAICPTHDMPYHLKWATYGDTSNAESKAYGLEGYDQSKPFSQFVLNRWNFNPQLLSPSVRADSRYGVDEIVSLSDADMKDPKKYEELLVAGHEILFGFAIHTNEGWTPQHPICQLTPGSDVVGGHIKLVVGYDRPRHFFVVKDSAGPTHYSSKDLANGFKDLVKYEGFTLMDYNYIQACGQAFYISKVAPVGSPRFMAQRALGQWNVSFERDHKPVMTGVLCWRRLPIDVDNDWRIGDLVTRDGQQYRVNGKLAGDGTKLYTLTLYVDFAGNFSRQSTEGATWKGILILPEKGGGSLQLDSAPEAAQSPWGVPTAELHVSGSQDDCTNLLKAMPIPTFSP